MSPAICRPLVEPLTVFYLLHAIVRLFLIVLQQQPKVCFVSVNVKNWVTFIRNATDFLGQESEFLGKYNLGLKYISIKSNFQWSVLSGIAGYHDVHLQIFMPKTVRKKAMKTSYLFYCYSRNIPWYLQVKTSNTSIKDVLGRSK